MTLNYKCPGCGGPMEFSAEEQVLKCTFCGNTLPIDAELEDQVESSTESEKEPEPEYDEYHGYKCPSCGAEIVTDDNTTATFCSFCGNPTMMEDRMDGVRRPSRVIPFMLDKQAARENFRGWTRKGLLTPGEFRKKATIEKLTGMYVPFWLYDYNANVRMTARCTRTRREYHGDDEIIYTDHFLVNRHIQADYDKLPADASEKMDDDLMDMLEPFEYNKLTSFNMGYLSGYYAEKYDYTSADMKDRIETRVKKYADDAARSTIIGYDSVRPISTNYALRCTNTEYVMMPVWMLNYYWKGKLQTVAINGETGKRAGKLPSSPLRVFLWWAGISVGSFGICLLYNLLK